MSSISSAWLPPRSRSLVLYGSDLLRDIGSTDATAVSSDEGEALALSPDFIDRLNARPNRSWTARVFLRGWSARATRT